MPVRFAPLRIPLERRLQTFAVLQWILSLIFMPMLSIGLTVVLLLSPLAIPYLLYLAWLLVFDRYTPRRGGRRIERVRRSKMWHYFRDYFPLSLVKTSELDPQKNYIIGYHPHGIISCGAFGNFATEATGFSEKFPGIRPSLLTLAPNFFWPLSRAYCLACGLCDVTKESIHYLMTQQGKGNAAVIVIGGAEEALEARPGKYVLTLAKRKGFVRAAISTGACLVPCFSFGENDLYSQAENPRGSKLRKFQEKFKSIFGVSPPLFYGRGVFNYTFGLMPYRHPVTTVIGSPIEVEKMDNPSEAAVNHVHKLYLESLNRLFDENKSTYGIPETMTLEFI